MNTKNVIDSYKDMVAKDTIKWYKVTCSFYDKPIAIKAWRDILIFIERHIGFDYTITGQYTEEITVDCEYKDNKFYKLY